MNIIFITHAVDQTLGGVSRVTMALAKEFDKRGYSCSFICWQGDKSKIDAKKVLYLSPDDDKKKFVDNSIKFAFKNKTECIINQDNYHPAIMEFLTNMKRGGKNN